jgi:hypothetical protein
VTERAVVRRRTVTVSNRWSIPRSQTPAQSCAPPAEPRKAARDSPRPFLNSSLYHGAHPHESAGRRADLTPNPSRTCNRRRQTSGRSSGNGNAPASRCPAKRNCSPLLSIRLFNVMGRGARGRLYAGRWKRSPRN